MRPILKWIFDQRVFVFSGLMFLSAFVALKLSSEQPIDFNKLQNKILQLDRDLQKSAKELLISNPNFYNPAKTPFFVHLYEGDSLIYWNTNKVPISKFTNIQFPSEGMNRLQNGWYYSRLHQKDGKKVVVSCQIRNEFDYENAFLENKSNEDLSESSFTISLNPNEGVQLKNAAGNYLFSVISPIKKQKDNPWVLVFICLAIASAALGYYYKFCFNRMHIATSFAFLIFTRFLFLITDVHQTFEFQSFVSADLFGYNRFFPTFLDFCLNVLLGSAGFALLGKIIQGIKFGKYFLPFCFIFGWWAIVEIIKMLVLYSAIPLNFLDFFDLTIYSYLSLFVIGLGLFTVYKVFELNLQTNDKHVILLIRLLAFASVFLFIFLQKSTLFSAFFPLILLVIFHVKQFNNGTKSFLFLTLFSMVLVADFNKHQILKEQENRKLYARQIAVEQDINLELAYADIKEKLKEDQLIKSVSKGQAEGVSQSDFGDILEKKYFKGEWDVYEQTFNLSDSTGKSIFTGEFQFSQTCQTLIDKYGEPSVVDSSLFFIKSSTGGFTYIIREKVNVEGSSFLFFVALKSKRIPEEIGFPRLLISKNANVLNSLEHYSVGKYAGKKLIRSFGTFHFPTSLVAFPKEKKTEQFINYDRHNHFILSKEKQSIILSIKNYEFVDYVSAFALVFCFLGLILLFSLFLIKGFTFQRSNWSLSLKIQYAVLLLVIFVLILFATGSGYYVQNQFQKSSDEVIENKLESIEEELQGKVSLISNLNIDSQGSFLESVLVKLARVFETDLNIYDKQGYLVASSRSKVFNQGLLSEQINPEAFEKINRKKRSFFTQKENIGKLNYVSSYQPIYNGEEKLLGYLNLQHFGQQQAFEEQLKSFVIAVVNVFIILLLLSIGIALLVSNWVTSPLKLLQKRVAGLEITSDVKIEYPGKDEIGTIVTAYNLKLDELQTAAKKLAKTERESAWREMAQQVAHEIKNPLTPMKLSIQQLLRVYDPSDMQSTDKVKRVMNSIIEQIDGMTRIANEFSRFAKMPDPNKKEVDLIVLIENTVSLFEAEEKIKFNIKSSEKQLILKIDKEQWVQVFNNLIQNAIHALEGKENGEITISVQKDNDSIFIDVSDNGCGISNDEQEKLFVPYFTTKSSGSGIGLSMVKQIVENHDGEISFVSELNKGTSFRIKLEGQNKLS
jgi:nitrogen fixation/metabolism regulation signal transduction histidine kinase